MNYRSPTRYQLSLLILLLFVLFCHALHAQPETANDRGQQVTGYKTYRVTMTTHFVVPQDDRKITEIRVYHALPTIRSWDIKEKGLGATQISITPDFAKILTRKEDDSHYILWKQDEELQSGAHLTFESTCLIRSADRNFQPGAYTLKWPTSYTPPANINPELAKVAEQIKATHDPGSAIIEFTKWISAHIQYDAGVTYPTSDITSIVANGRGHCGHRCAVFRQLCQEVGIPVRRVAGLFLKTPDGATDRLQQIREDFNNIHAWAEVFFPEAGWIEVEPSGGARAFTIPAKYIQDNKWFEAYSVWITENGVKKRPSWDYEEGKFFSQYGIEHIINFTEVLN